MSQIHKYNVTHASRQLGVHTVPGIARTIGIDTTGDLVVWYETGIEHDFTVAFTGEELDDRYQVVGSTVWAGLVWHLAVPIWATPVPAVVPTAHGGGR